METTICLQGVRAYGYVGLLPEENVLGQWFEVDAVLAVDFRAATVSDDIVDTYDYRQAIAAIETTIQTSPFKLVERLAGEIAERLLADEWVTRATVKVKKWPPIPNFTGSVAVEITRARTRPWHE
ncbi:MAG: dihydroneopterin aldolase [Oscillatoriales cyanobacterium SM2_1_8]|nr:dihydroneopterin aldolase [Oscillatoriales cyanobacterium SM2_1_8]